MFGKRERRKKEGKKERTIKCRNETRIITGMKIKRETDRSMTVEIFLRSKEDSKDTRVFTRKFYKRSTTYKDEWSHKLGDEVTVLIGQDGIMRNIS